MTAAPERVAQPALAGRVASILPPCPWDLTPDELCKLADSVIGVAMRLAGIIHDEDPQEAGSLVAGLNEQRAWALPFVAVAMIDIDKTATDLLGWAPFTPPARLRKATSTDSVGVLLRSTVRNTPVYECGSEQAWQRHRAHDEEPCDACWDAHRAYENAKKRRGRRRKAEREGRFNKVLDALAALREEQPDLFSTLPDERESDAA